MESALKRTQAGTATRFNGFTVADTGLNRCLGCTNTIGDGAMKLKVVIHEAEEGGYWAEVPAIPGCATQGETFDELLENLYEAVEGCLSVDLG